MRGVHENVCLFADIRALAIEKILHARPLSHGRFPVWHALSRLIPAPEFERIGKHPRLLISGESVLRDFATARGVLFFNRKLSVSALL